MAASDRFRLRETENADSSGEYPRRSYPKLGTHAYSSVCFSVTEHLHLMSFE